MVHITDTRSQKVVTYSSVHITETIEKRFILTTAVSSFARAQKMDAYTVAHHTTVGSTCPTLRSKTLSQHILLFYAVCAHCVHYFFLHKSNTDEMQTLKQFTSKYCIWSPYRCVE